MNGINFGWILLLCCCSLLSQNTSAHTPTFIGDHPSSDTTQTTQKQSILKRRSRQTPRKAPKKKLEQFTPEDLMRFFIEEGDTIYVSDLAPAYKFAFPDKGKEGREWRKFYRTVHNFAKTYPYALIAKARLDTTETYLAKHELTKREREKYLTSVQKALFEEFEGPLRKLTFTQGRMLLRLIDREIGITSYYIIKEYRGSAAAGFWQGIGWIFGADLKTPYDKFGEDKELEDLVQVYHAGQFDYLYFSIFGEYPPKLPVKYHDIIK